MGIKVDPVSVNLKVAGELLSDTSDPNPQRFFSSDTYPELKASGYTSTVKIKAAIKLDAYGMLKEASDARKNWQFRTIGTNEGTVMIVYWELGAWQIRLAGPGRHGFGGMASSDGFDDTVEYARKWAVECFDGVKWES